MKLTKLQITNFQSIEDSTEFSVDNVTALVGKNESGKTSILKALEKLNPVYPARGSFDYVKEYPRNRMSDYAQDIASGGEHDNVVKSTWILEPEDSAALEEILGPSASQLKSVIVSKGYDNEMRFDFDFNQVALIQHLISEASLEPEEKKVLAKAESIADLASGIGLIESPSEAATALLSKCQQTFPDNDPDQEIINILDKRLPKFLYFGDYNTLPGQVSLEAYAERKTEKKRTSQDYTFAALLDSAGITIETLTQAQRFDEYLGRLEGVSNKISGQLFKYWSQNKHLKVTFRIDQGRPGDPAPFNAGNVFRTQVENTRHGATVNFSNRSSGFIWFFSFLVSFTQVKRQNPNLFILLDEPGLTLHAKAQEDLLRFFREVLKPTHYLMYTTHSPFMIDPGSLTSARTVEDRLGKDDEVLGTKVDDQVLSTDKDTVFPLQAALGYDITQSLFIGPNSLCVEGPSEVAYFTVISKRLIELGRQGLSSKWTICPVGGLDKIASFVALFGGNKLNVATVIDYQKGDKNKVENLRNSKLLNSGRVFTVNQYCGLPEADVEDLFGREFYVALVNDWLSGTGATPVPAVAPVNAPQRVVKEIEDHMRVQPNTVPEFDHYKPAEHLLRNPLLLSTLPGSSQALNNFEKLFTDLNAAL